MKILFTGASSFTGMWFARELAKAGHNVTAAFLRPHENYHETRRQRVDEVTSYCQPMFNCPFGTDPFLKLVKEHNWDMLCHHAADVTNYKSPDFDFAAALTANTKNIKQIIHLLKDKGCAKILLTGSLFEKNEGQGSDNLRAVSPYGLSKGLTTDVFEYFSAQFGMKLGKFVISNPFGPYEEPRFTTFLIRSWFDNTIPRVSFPDYIRDNIHVSLLAKAYVDFAHKLTNSPGLEKQNPIGYQESQGEFTHRFADEMRKRLSIDCPFNLGIQKDFPEPKERLNTNQIDCNKLSWNEQQAWDELAQYYLKEYGMQKQSHCGCGHHHS
ncbi:MAG TPA: NAD(P)-dependent oxidoreductase [Waddliaceae bacterium]